MRWWLRLVVTLIVAPLLWQLGAGYLASQQGASWNAVAQQAVGLLAGVYITFTLPALAICLVLLAVDWLLHKIGADLLTVLVSPLIAGLVATALVRLMPEARAAAAQGAVVLAVVYGLVWGLTIREPDPGRRARRTDATA